MQIRQFERRLTTTDLAFLADLVGTEAANLVALGEEIESDEGLRARLLGDHRVFEAIDSSDGPLAAMSPRFYFEVLLRRAVNDLQTSPHTMERSGSERVPVFDAAEVVQLTARPAVLRYLSEMLASFTKVHSYTERVWVRRGVVRKVRYSDLDVHSMLRLAHNTDEAERLPVYKRTADLCLFVLGLFPDYAATANRYPGSGALRAQRSTRYRLSTEEYETVASQMYGLAARHQSASGVSDVFELLSRHVIEAKKPLNFLSEHYLGFRRDRLFGISE